MSHNDAAYPAMASNSRFKVLSAVATLAIAISGVVATGPNVSAQTTPNPTESQTRYVYWAYWSGVTGQWETSAVGAGSVTPSDGAVDGWGYGTGAATDATAMPGTAPDFTAICGSMSPRDGQKRVAIAVDFGTTSIAPSGVTPPSAITRCAVVPNSANSIQALQSVTSVRTSPEGMVCGINGYPPTGCGEQLAAAGPTSTTAVSTSTSSSPWVAIVGVIALVIMALAALIISRRRSNE